MRLLRIFLALPAAIIALLLALPVVAGLLILGVIATLANILSRLIEPRFVTWQELIEFHPMVGWISKPNLNTRALVDDLFHFTTDADGWRGKTNLTDSEIVVFGDSHAFGYGIDEKYFFANLDRRVEVKSLGVISYNMVQEVLWMRELSQHLKNKMVVWLVFLGNDLGDNLEPAQYHYRSPFLRESKGMQPWEIVTTHLDPKPWPFVFRRYKETNYDRLTKIYSPTFVSDRAFAAAEYLITEAFDICNRAAARLTVLTIPDPMILSQAGLNTLYANGADSKTFDPNLPDKKIRSICEKLNLPFVSGAGHFGIQDYKQYDSHWNKAGHKRMADLLSDLYEKHQRTCRPATIEAVLNDNPKLLARI